MRRGPSPCQNDRAPSKLGLKGSARWYVKPGRATGVFTGAAFFRSALPVSAGLEKGVRHPASARGAYDKLHAAADLLPAELERHMSCRFVDGRAFAGIDSDHAASAAGERAFVR